MSSTVLNIIILSVNVILWLIFYIKYKRTFSPENILHAISEEVDKLLIEIDKSADRDLTLIEERTNNLRAMIDEADKRTQLAISEERKAELSHMGAKKINAATKSAAAAYQKAKPRPAENTNAEELTYIPEEHVSRKQQTAKTPDYETEMPKNVQTELPFDVTVSEDFTTNKKTLQQKVLELWRQDLDTEFIAEKLSVSEAEVQMIVDIYGN